MLPEAAVHRNASNVFGGVSGEVYAERNRRVFSMEGIVIMIIAKNPFQYENYLCKTYMKLMRVKKPASPFLKVRYPSSNQVPSHIEYNDCSQLN
jgi:hypothetical protein